MIAAFVAWSVPAAAQCQPVWSTFAHPGADGWVYTSTMWDPDGAGPLARRLVVGGSFEVAGTVRGNGIAAFDFATSSWSSFGDPNGYVLALTGLPNGDLVAAGDHIAIAGGTQVARWNGSQWLNIGWVGSFFGSGSTVDALATLPNGHVVAGGQFGTIGGVVAPNIAIWNGVSWAPLGGGIVNTSSTIAWVQALAVLPNGHLIAAGTFAGPNNIPTNIARWDGANWYGLGSGMNGAVHTLSVLANGDVIAGGAFTTAGGVAANRIARWDGVQWSAFGSGLDGSATATTVLSNGDIVVGGGFTTAGGVPATDLARWDGTAWSAYGALTWTPNTVRTLATLPGDRVAIGGRFVLPAGNILNGNLLVWDGASWSGFGLPEGPRGTQIGAMAETAAGQLVAGDQAFDGLHWTLLGAGLSRPVKALLAHPQGDLIAAGSFSGGAVPTLRYVARWDGVAWLPLGTGLPTMPLPWEGGGNAIALAANGDLIVCGTFPAVTPGSAGNLARWDGTSWSTFAGGTNGSVHAVVIEPNGGVVIAGAFTQAGSVPCNRVARWDGATWTPLGSGLSATAYELLRLANGDLVAAGTFTVAGGVAALRIARWDGSAWSPLGSGFDGAVHEILELPNGDVAATGGFTSAGGVPLSGIARWDGTVWSAAGPAIPNGQGLFARADGTVLVRGSFTQLGTSYTHHLAAWTTTCPATAVAAGAGCTGSGGANVLTATSLPWIGTTFRSVATGMPAISLALVVRGFSTLTTPLSAILPQGVAGCSLLVSPDLLDLGVPAAGSLQMQLAIPNSVALVAQTFHEQVVPIELGAAGAILALTGTNALSLTIGAF